jgi:toxin ParE1/3/4
VSKFRYSFQAEADLEEIGLYSMANWGEEQAILYIKQLEACCELVANSPGTARKCDDIRVGYRRMEEGSHVLFFKPDAQGLLVVRVLHERMLPGLHITDNDEDE